MIICFLPIKRRILHCVIHGSVGRQKVLMSRLIKTSERYVMFDLPQTIENGDIVVIGVSSTMSTVLEACNRRHEPPTIHKPKPYGKKSRRGFRGR